MAYSVTLFDHTVIRFLQGLNSASDVYKINLYSAFTLDPSATTKAAAETGATQLPTSHGYSQDSKALTNVAVEAFTTNDGRFAADNVSWSASGGDIGPASYAMIYNDTDANKPPLLLISFGEAKTANDTTPFNIVWNSNGIILFSYTAGS